MTVLQESPLKVKAPAQPAAYSKYVSPQPRPSRGPEVSLSRIRVRSL